MKQTMFEFSKETTSKDLIDSFSNEDKTILQDFKEKLLVSASEKRTYEAIREVIRFKVVIGKELNDINLKDLQYFLTELRNSKFADYTKNKIKEFVKRFLRFKYKKDWTERFEEFEDIKSIKDPQRKREITDKEIIGKEDVQLLLEAEPSLFWKTFLLTQYQGALRTGEARNLKWDQVIFGEDGFTTLKIPARKNPDGTIKVKSIIIKEAGIYLKELKKKQDKHNINSQFVFPSPKDRDKPISKTANLWFSDLCKKVLGRKANNYLLRHGKGTELEEQVKKGKISKDNAVDFMRHSQKMFDKTYSHMNEQDRLKIMKEQFYPEEFEELTKDEKNELTKLKRDVLILHKQFKKFVEAVPEHILNQKIKLKA